MRLLITIFFIFIGSTLVASTIDQLSAFGNGVMRLIGAALIIGSVYSFHKSKNKK
jgi:hypothetical protein